MKRILAVLGLLLCTLPASAGAPKESVAPISEASAITTSDTALAAPCRALYIGGSGDVAVDLERSSTDVFASVIATYTDANLPAANDTVIISSGTTTKTYTFKSSVSVEGDVLIVALDPDATALNLVHAINASGGVENTDWKAAARNALVSAARSTAGAGTGTITLTARVSGDSGNTIVVNGTFAGSAFFADTFLTTATSTTIKGAIAGTVLPIRALRVRSATTATFLLCLN